MPLRIERISQQIDQMAQTIADAAPVQEDSVRLAQGYLHSLNADALRQKLAGQRLQQPRIPWLVAMPRGSLCNAVAPSAPPARFCAAGSDASSIAPDRHSSVRYYVINVGYALLTYGTQSDAELGASSQLCFKDQDLYVFPEKRDVPVEGTLLGARMEVESLRVLQQSLRQATDPTVALRDGPLILWTLQNETEDTQRTLLRGLFDAMSWFRQNEVPLAGYISYTGARDVANSLRVWICQGRPNDCEHCENSDRELCWALATIHDRDLYSFLKEGERTDLFGSSSQILEIYGEHRADFFYMNVGGEIVRVEVPQWVGMNRELLNLLHAVIHDQCQRSPGFPPYPPALLEAHEQAVISTSERRLVEEMAERALGQHGYHITRSAKDYSKRRRGV